MTKSKLTDPSEFEKLQLQQNGGDPRDNIENYSSEGTDRLFDKPSNITSKFQEQVKNVLIPDLNGNIYWEGWIKYFHYDGVSRSISKPNKFYENPEYFKQRTDQQTYSTQVDGKGLRVHIPSENYFWAQLLNTHNFNILGTRHNAHLSQAKTIENMNTDLIGEIKKDNNANGAVKDLGTFSEGSCIKVTLKIPINQKNPIFNPRTDDGNKQVWIICTDNEESKNNLMGYLIAIKLRRQSEIDDVFAPVDNEKKSVSEFVRNKPVGPIIVRNRGLNASPDDGYWILLQDWSECSLKCGGGTQTQQWVCVPPKNKGQPCIGETIRTRSCNVQLCPNAGVASVMPAQTPNHITLSPIYKALPFSTTPQQYIKCLIKENDISYMTTKYDPENKVPSKIPGKIVMNTQTVSVFTDDSYKSALFTFNLSDTTFKYSNNDFCCFYLTNANRQFEICGLHNSCGSKDKPIWVDEWHIDFDFFRTKCAKELKETNLRINVPSILPRQPGVDNNNMALNGIQNSVPSSLDKFFNPQANIVGLKKQYIENSIEKTMENENAKKINDTNKISLTALRREINLEDLIKKEEIQKGQQENLELQRQVQQEKRKKNLLLQALQNREQNFGKIRDQKQTIMKMDEIKKEAKIEIKFKRAVLKKKLDAIRNKFKRKNRLLQQQVQLLRSEEADLILDANRKGDKKKCEDGRNDLEKMKTYCNTNFADDVQKNTSCKDPSNFCYSCCESEFGNMFMNERDDCETMCDNLNKKDLEDGDWVWSHEVA